MIDFFKTLFSYWQGLLIGVVVGAIICVLIGKWIYQNKVSGTIITVAMCLVFGFFGFLVQSWFFPNVITDPNHPDYNIIYDPNVNSIDLNTLASVNSNGGFDRNYIEDKLKTADITEDKFFNITLTEYAEIVIYSFDTTVEDTKFTYNVLFNKINDGKSIVFDGAFNVNYSIAGTYLGVDTKLKFNNNMDLGNNFSPLKTKISLDTTHPDMFLYSNAGSLFFCSSEIEKTGSTWIIMLAQTMKSAYKTMQDGVGKFYLNNFQQLGDLGIMLYEEDIEKQLNTFYTGVYKAVKANNTSMSAVNVTNSCAYYNATEDKFYNANLFLNVRYKDYKDTSIFPEGGDLNAGDEELKDKVDKEVIDYPTSASVKFLLNPNGNYNMTNFNLAETPVTITLKSDKDTYILNFNQNSMFGSGLTRAINYGTYTVTATSNVLQLGTLGTLTVSKDTEVVKFNYSYEYGTILTTVRLNPLSNLALEDLDLETNPVTVTLNNGTSSYNFVFNNKETINEPITQRLLLGNYTWSIQSSQLVFSTLTGTLQVSTNSHSFVFNYDYKTNVEYVITKGSFSSSEDNTRNLLEDKTIGVKVDYSACNFDKAVARVELFHTIGGHLYHYDLTSPTGISEIIVDTTDYSVGTYLNSEIACQIKFTFTDGTTVLTNVYSYQGATECYAGYFYTYTYKVVVG
ncbi:MAG: hypothetical protein J6Q51_01135 [Clostridia bacterium]|nr:hypothetical protein [Clostridia bacterium]